MSRTGEPDCPKCGRPMISGFDHINCSREYNDQTLNQLQARFDRLYILATEYIREDEILRRLEMPLPPIPKGTTYSPIFEPYCTDTTCRETGPRHLHEPGETGGIVK